MLSFADDHYERVLVANLQRAIDFLKFAETKNAALLALSSAWVLASLNIEATGKPLPPGWSNALAVVTFSALLAALIAIFSFLPKLNLHWFLGGKRAGPHPRNLLYFGDIAQQLILMELKDELHGRYFPTTDRPRDEYINDLVVQIGVNSQIAMRKMRFFKCSMGIFVIGCLTLFGMLIIQVTQGILWH
ncbi:MAG: DUF5706 domain-containing protein [Syntrophales bacterium LBB04]|nr:DUF5706 domain-containing protein [Syntrophales bacterium LBB04]